MNVRAAFLILGAFISSPALSADSPVRLRAVGGGYLLVPVTLNGVGPFEFLLDTGTTITLIEPALARRLALPFGQRESIASITFANEAQRARVETLTVGSKTVANAEVLVTDLGDVGRIGGRVQGVLGNDVLGHENFLLSYTKGRLEFDGDGSLAARLTGMHAPFREMRGRRLVEAEVPGVRRPLLLVPDSGCLRVVLFEKASRDLGAALKVSGGIVLAGTVTGGRRSPSAVLRGLRLGGDVLFDLDTLLLHVSSALEGRPEDGLLPTSLFREIWFDHEGGFLILNPKVAR